VGKTDQAGRQDGQQAGRQTGAPPTPCGAATLFGNPLVIAYLPRLLPPLPAARAWQMARRSMTYPWDATNATHHRAPY